MKKYLLALLMCLMAFLAGSAQNYTEPDAGLYVETNDLRVVEILKEFSDRAEFEELDYQPDLKQLRKIMLVPGNNQFISAFDKNGVLYISDRYAAFDELLRIRIYQELGLLYGLKRHEKGNTIMSEKWIPSLGRQKIAVYIKENGRGWQEKKFFAELKERLQIKYQYANF